MRALKLALLFAVALAGVSHAVTTNLPPTLRQRYFDSNGDPLAGGLLYTYQSGTTTPQATYTDQGGGTANANPIVLDANGEAAMWLNPSLTYKFVLKNSSGVTQWTTDNVVGLLAPSSVVSATIADGAVTGAAGGGKLAYSAVNGQTADTAPAMDDEVLTADTSAAGLKKATKSNLIKKAFAAKTANYTVTANDHVLTCDATGGAVTFTLPATVAGREYTIVKIDSSTNACILDGNASETILGQLTYSLVAQWGRITIVGDGSSAWAVTALSNPWRVDANISGANPSLGTSAQSSYVGIENGSLTLANNTGTGVLTAQIPCSGTNSPSGTTCSAGNESIGVCFSLPNPGEVGAYLETAHEATTNNGATSATFQIVETPSNAQTISAEGRTRIESRLADPGVAALEDAVSVSGTFTFATAGTKCLRLFYEMPAASGSITSHTVMADAGSSNGQRDIHIVVRPLN